MSRRRPVVIVASLVLLGCGVGPNGLDLGRPVAQVLITPSVASFEEGDTVRFTAVTLDKDGRRTTPRKSPVWSTPDPTHLRVDSTGLARGLLAGTAAVQLTADSVTGVARVTVLPLPVGSVEVIVPPGVIEVGDTVRLTAMVRDIQGKRLLLSVVWVSSDPTRIEIDSSGLLRAVAAGGARITARVDSVSGGVDLAALVPVAAVRVIPDSLALQYDDTARLSVQLLDSSGAILPARPVTWSIAGDAGVITLSPSLLVNATDSGRAIVTAAARHAQGSAVVDVAALVLTTVSVGATHTCGLRSDGTAWCWGDGSTGALGRGDTLSVSRPKPVAGGLIFSQVSAGDHLTCGLTPTGVAYCWGLNGLMQTGTAGGSPCANPFGSAAVCVLAPALVQGGPVFATIVAGSTTACALTSNGAGYCWGAGGILGDSTTQTSGTPVAVVGGHVFRELGKPNETGTCGRDVGGAIYCWGLAPVPLLTASGIDTMTVDTMTGSAGTYCGLRAGDLFCWGWIVTDDVSAGGSGVHPMLQGTQFVRIAATFDHMCGVTVAGGTLCWGRNTNGELGDGTLVGRFDSTGTTVAGGHVFTDIEVGGMPFFGVSHSCGVANDGHTYCWGSNSAGQIGRAVGFRSLSPVTPAGQR
jgi:alpha-tubulin suppressor-like RCC1 family protein